MPIWMRLFVSNRTADSLFMTCLSFVALVPADFQPFRPYRRRQEQKDARISELPKPCSIERLEAENRKLREPIATLEVAFGEADRAKHRQTSRFPRRRHVVDPKKPGSQKGHLPRLRSQPD